VFKKVYIVYIVHNQTLKCLQIVYKLFTDRVSIWRLGI
jgi:hypothetical protein